MTQVVLQPPGSDAYINMANPYTNYGNSAALWVGKQSDSVVYRTLIIFDISSIPAGINVLSATLKLYIDYSPSPGITGEYTPYIITSPWNKSSVTWNNMPAFDTSICGSTTSIQSTGWYQWDVTPIVSAWFTGIYPNYGMIIKGNESITFEYKRAVSGDVTGPIPLESTPMLIIEYDMSPPGTYVTISGRRFTEEWSTHLTSDNFTCTNGYNTSQQSIVTFFVKNTGENPATVKLEISPNNSDYIQDGPETIVPPGVMKPFVPMIFGKYTRICYKSTNLSQNTTLLVIYQAHI